MKINTYVSKRKNLMGEYNAQLDFGETQIQIITPFKKDLVKTLTQVKAALRPINKREFDKAFEAFLETPFKELYQDTVLLNAMREAAEFGFNYNK